MSQGKGELLREIARQFKDGELSLHEAALRAGMTEAQFEKVVRSYAWVEQQASRAGRVAGAAAKAGSRFWSSWAKKG